MTLEILVRRVAAQEWPRLRELRLRALADAPDVFSEPLVEALAQPDERWRSWAIEAAESPLSAVFVAVACEVWAGMTAGLIRSEDRDVAWMSAMWVDPAYRRHGTGRRLIDQVSAWAADHGATELRLHVTDTNAGARALYTDSGFVATHAARRLVPSGVVTTIEMRLRLTGQ